ncbi:hypothetical protein O181_102476 [Austropuccinia psidii MF-1]|uniref:Uncharacterized protein n=1 Tax=Austropuccinia psidii MF-1 TaxID=1389203 RepID=A0A9Q3PJL2_9BASI|nr:hypothetical protein [Austropuccinia psidii MF-1]
MAKFPVSGAYLYSPVEETVYFHPLVELIPEVDGKVMHLCLTLYGMKQVGHCWWLMETKVEQSLHILKHRGHIILVWIHVDDGLVASELGDLILTLPQHLRYLGFTQWIGFNTGRHSAGPTKQHWEALRSANQTTLGATQKGQLNNTRRNLEDHTKQNWEALRRANQKTLGGTQKIQPNKTERHSEGPTKPHWEALRQANQTTLGGTQKGLPNKTGRHSEGPTKQHWEALRRAYKTTLGGTQKGQPNNTGRNSEGTTKKHWEALRRANQTTLGGPGSPGEIPPEVLGDFFGVLTGK